MVGARRDSRKETYWRRQLQKQKASGLSLRAFCRQHALAESAFYYWRREIEWRDREHNRTATRAFVPVEVKTPAHAPSIEVALACGHVVRLRPGFDADTLRKLLALLEESSC